VQKSKIIDGKKFMWDGVEYTSEIEAGNVMAKHEAEHFETLLVAEENRFFVFTRRVVTEIKIEGAPPV